jgi:hypothetical protein
MPKLAMHLVAPGESDPPKQSPDGASHVPATELCRLTPVMLAIPDGASHLRQLDADGASH